MYANTKAKLIKQIRELDADRTHLEYDCASLLEELGLEDGSDKTHLAECADRLLNSLTWVAEHRRKLRAKLVRLKVRGGL